jgi:hypothetical protein
MGLKDNVEVDAIDGVKTLARPDHALSTRALDCLAGKPRLERIKRRVSASASLALF